MNDLLGLRWTHIYDIKDPTLIDSTIVDNIISVLDVHAPVKFFRTGSQKNKTSRKLSKECIYQIQNRNRMRRHNRRTNLDIDWDNWKK